MRGQGYGGFTVIGSFPATGARPGVALMMVRHYQVGFFLDGKLGTQRSWESGDYYENISIHEAEDWGDSRRHIDNNWETYDAGVTYGYTHSFALYLGLGFSHSRQYVQYYDPFHILGRDGLYWVDGKPGVNLLNTTGGMLLRVGRSGLFQIGLDSQPASACVGFGWVFDRIWR
jgi:hypothetical protein